MKTQLKLELEKKPIPEKRTHYLDLSIDQKINLKSNSGGFELVWLLKSRWCFKQHEGYIGYRDITTHLTKRYFEHYYLNHGTRPYPIKSQLF